MATRDLTIGKPASGLIKFAIPLILGNMLQQLYNLVDVLIVGRYCGSTALAAVGASSPVLLLYTSVSIGGGLGAGVIIAQMFGAKRYGDMMTAIKTTLLTFFVSGTLLTLLGTLVNNTILAAINTPADVFDSAALYMRIYLYGFVFTMMFNVCNGVFNALGDSKSPLLFLLISAVLNVGLNIYFITQLGMTVDGVAWATIISQGIAAAVSITVLYFKLRGINTKEPSVWFDASMLRRIFRVAGPSIIQQSIVSVGVLLLQSVINGFGAIAVAGYIAANKIDLVAILPMTNMGAAMSSFTAQNIGAGKHERVKQGLKAGVTTVVGMGLFIALFLVVFGSFLVSLFVTGDDAALVIAEGAGYLKISSCFYFVFGIMNTFGGILRGSGDMKGFMIVTFTNLGVRVLLANLIAAHIGLYMVGWCTAIGWALSMIFAILRYRSGKWLKQKLI